MVIFSLLTMNTSLSFQVTVDTMVRSELEYRAISAAQEEIDSIRWVTSRYKSQDPFNSSNTNYLYNKNPIQRTFTYGPSEQYAETFTIYRNAEESTDCKLIDTSNQRCYEITITVENKSLDPAISITQKITRTLTFSS